MFFVLIKCIIVCFFFRYITINYYYLFYNLVNLRRKFFFLLPFPPNISFQIGRRIANIVASKKKPVVCFIPYVSKYEMIIESLELAYIPVFHSIKEAVQAVSALKHRTKLDNVNKGNIFWEN